MDSGGPVQLAGSNIHGFHTFADLDFVKMMEEAHSRWLRPNEIHAVLYNYTLFNIRVKPVHLPQSGAILLFDRKMLRNFRKDGHNWKKKKDGKTVKEAHEHLKVGDEERIHVYYAHGDDNSTFVRRCYWLLDKKYEHIVLVHYRETSELQSSPVTPLNSNSSSSQSDASASRVLLEETDTAADNAISLDSGTSSVIEELGDNLTMRNHEKRLHEINTLEWEDLLVSDQNNFTALLKGNTTCLEQQNQFVMNGSQTNGSLLSSNNTSEAISSFTRLRNQIVANGSIDSPCNEFEVVTEERSKLSNIVNDGLETQDSFGRWLGCMLTDDSPLNDLPVQSPISTSHEPMAPMTEDHHQLSTEEKIFSITDVAPAWAFSTVETKVLVVGYFNKPFSYPATSNLVFVFGDACVPAEEVQAGVFRCKALPHDPGFVNFYLSLDGYTPISQVMSLEYRAPPLESGVASPEANSKWEDFQVQVRLARLLFSTTNYLNIRSNKVSPTALREAKKFALAASSIDKDWAYLIKSIGNKDISFMEAKNNLFEITLKNKLQEWLLGRLVEGSKTAVRDRQGQGVIHFCAILGYSWAVRPYAQSGLSLDFRDNRGWTALHWAAYCGREKMVAVLLSAGADPSLVSDPTPEFPGGCIAADLASKYGYEGLAAYLAEKGLTEHFKRMSISGHISGSLQTSDTIDPAKTGLLTEEQLCQKDSLAAYRTAAEAASRIQAAFRENSLKLQAKAAEASNPEIEARCIVAALKIQHAFRNYESRKRMAAAARIQHRFRSWKIRKDFLNMRRQVIRIQAAFRAHRARKEYRKILWSVGVLEKAILRWRQKRKGFRGLQVEPAKEVVVKQTQEDGEEDFFRISRMQAEARIERSVTKVQALFRSRKAQEEYRRMKKAYHQAQLEELLELDCGD